VLGAAFTPHVHHLLLPRARPGTASPGGVPTSLTVPTDRSAPVT